MLKKSLLLQLYLAYLFITVAALIVITLYLSQLLPEFYYNQVADDLQSRARLVERQILTNLKTNRFEGLDERIKKLGTSSSTRITIILRDGNVIAESEKDLMEMKNHWTSRNLSRRVWVVERIVEDVSLKFQHLLTLLLENGALKM